MGVAKHQAGICDIGDLGRGFRPDIFELKLVDFFAPSWAATLRWAATSMCKSTANVIKTNLAGDVIQMVLAVELIGEFCRGGLEG
ncbi:hypothetical protein [Pseudomonas coronafaciens]|uniref:hypothetical protein n=1 Tax=Pseudomonas tremae TaxID=200454 RepID=UPI001604DF46|nr:hypothetical protein [Pseudomonas tremae]UQB34890.1 hypothetical protein I9H09_14980 [Pseudomonas tremae]